MAQRELELSTKERERSAKLVPGIGDEVAFALHRRLQPGEHGQRFTQPFDLVARRRNGQSPTRSLGGDGRSAPPHRLHRTQGEAGKEVSRQGGERERDRAGNEEHVAETGERLVSVTACCPDDEHKLLAAAHDGRREEPRRLVQTGHRLTIHERRPTTRRAKLVCVQQSPRAKWSSRIENTSPIVEQLSKCFPVLDERDVARRRQAYVPSADEGVEVVCPQTQAAVERSRELRIEPGIEEPAGCSEDERHGQRERGRHPEPDRRPSHGALFTRNRYPAPRIVSMDFRPKGSSIFLRKCRT